MSRARLSTKCSLLLLMSLSLCVLPACVFEAGVGDPAQAKVDREFAGIWVNQADTSVAVLTATANKDGKTYAVKGFVCDGSLEAPTKATLRVTGQAWLSDVGGERFVTIKVLEFKLEDKEPTKPEKPYAIFKVHRADDRLELTQLADKFRAFQDAKTREDMERAVKDNIGNAAAYGSPTTYKRSTAAAVKKVTDLFEQK